MGWIGVDLFFVLSGFLVSGLLFKEYLKFGDIHAIRFLVRRGFKIYPIYYLFSIPYIIPILWKGNFSIPDFLYDMVFIQNYVNGWGYAFGASWSLAVEEHFYFGLSIFLWMGLKYDKINLQKKDNPDAEIGTFANVIIFIMATCLLLRILSNLLNPEDYARNFTMTHLRIDSLLTGVLISYLYYFRFNKLNVFFQSHQNKLLILAIACLAWTPFINPVPSFFVKTYGFTLLFISFGIILLYVLLSENINKKLNDLFTEPVVNIISKIGYCSYSIYVIHLFVNSTLSRVIRYFELYNNTYLNFLIAFTFSIAIGMIMTYKIENYFLNIRNRYFPGRV